MIKIFESNDNIFHWDGTGEVPRDTKNLIIDTDVIYSNTFFKYVNLEYVELTDKVVEISDGAFSKCRNLKKIKLSNNLKWIGNYAFSDCYSLYSIVIPESVKSIDGGAFYNCTSLEKVRIKGNPNIADNAFKNTLYDKDNEDILDEYRYAVMDAEKLLRDKKYNMQISHQRLNSYNDINQRIILLISRIRKNTDDKRGKSRTYKKIFNSPAEFISWVNDGCDISRYTFTESKDSEL